jgi:hypothetical protein
MKDIHHWTNICIEAFCAINWDYNSKKDKYCFQLIKKKGSYLKKNGDFRTKKVPNEQYVEGIEKLIPPEFCHKKLGYRCLKHNCPHLAYTESMRKKRK